MYIDLLADGKVSLSMKDYIKESINLFSEELSVTVFSTAKMVLNYIHEIYTRLEKKDLVIIHYMVARLIWAAKRVRTNIEPYISFLCTRANKSTNAYKAKLRRVLQYLKQTIKYKRIIGVDSLR